MERLKILVIEDSQSDVDLALEAFEHSGFDGDIRICVDGEEALKYLLRLEGYTNSPRPDLILLDINLPKANGFEILEEIKTHESLRHIPVIVVSTSDSPNDVYRSYSKHANAYIVKPSSLDGYFELVYSLKRFWLDTVSYSNSVEK